MNFLYKFPYQTAQADTAEVSYFRAEMCSLGAVLCSLFLIYCSLFLVPAVFAQEKLDVSGLVEEPADELPVSAGGQPATDIAGSLAAAGSAAETPPPKHRRSTLEIINAGGTIGYVIMLLSFVSVALMFEHSLTIRKKMLMPPGFADEILQQLSQGQLAGAVTKCRENPSILARILYTSMSQCEFGWEAVEKSADEALAEQTAKLYRKTEYLTVIGNIAPMLGLLGTVVGMVFAFQQLAESEGYARAADLAEGIYIALVTTVQGLVVAIPSLAAYSFFNNRIASLMNETASVTEQVLRPIKKSFAKKKT